MVRFSKREDYGMILMAKLCQSYGRKLTPLSEIAREYKISILFLRQLAQDLRRAGLIRAIEGRNGGYKLAKAPGVINIGAVISALSSKPILACCQVEHLGKCPKENLCKPGFVWRKLNNEFLERVYNLNLQEFLHYGQTKH